MDDRLTLRAGAWEAALLPTRGGALAVLRHAERDILVPVPPGADPNRGRHGAFLMVPWTNRLDGGRLPVGDAVHRMPVNWPDGTAIHGLARDAPFAVEATSADRAVLVQRLRHAPFSIETRVDVALGPEGLRLELAIRNLADDEVPMGLGWHPFFVRPAGTRIRFGATHVLGRDARTLPTAARPTAGVAGGEGTYLGLDDHFAGWDGAFEIAWPDGAALRLSATGACARNLHLFAPHETPVICAEPVSHAPDAPNRAAAALHGALHPLAPGASRSTSLQIHLRG